MRFSISTIDLCITTLIMLRVTILFHVYYFFEVDYSVHVEMYI